MTVAAQAGPATTDEGGTRLTQAEPDVIFVSMLTPEHAVDDYLDDLTRRDYSARSITTYRRTLNELCEFLERKRGRIDVSEITTDDIRGFWGQWIGKKRRGPGRYAANTRADVESTTNSFFKALLFTEKIKRNPCDLIARTQKPRSEDLDVLTVSTADVQKLLETAFKMGWTEVLSVAIPAFMGPRRRAVAQLRVKDYNRDTQHLRFREKGAKVVWKPIPDELVPLLNRAVDEGVINLADPDSYLVPSPQAQRRPGERDDRVIWRAVQRVAEKAGVVTHVHALRAAFAVFYLEQHPGDLEALQPLMGHEQLSTTQMYLRRLDRNVAMERVRTLSWGVSWGGNAGGLGSSQSAGNPMATNRLTEKEGFEPSLQAKPSAERAGTERSGDRLPEDLVERIPAADSSPAEGPV